MRLGPSLRSGNDSPLIIAASSVFALSRSREHRFYIKVSSSTPVPMWQRFTSPHFTVWQHKAESSDTEFLCHLLTDSTGLNKWKEVYTDFSDSVYAFRCPTAAGRSHPIEDFTDYFIFFVGTEKFESEFDLLVRQFLENCSEDEMIRRKGTFPAHFSALEELSEQLVLSMSPKALTALLALYSLTGAPNDSRNAHLAVETLGTSDKLVEFLPISNFSERAFRQCSQELPPTARDQRHVIRSEEDFSQVLTSPVYLLRCINNLPLLIKAAGMLVDNSSRGWKPEFNLLAATMLQKTKLTADEVTTEISRLSDTAKAFICTTVLGQYCPKTQPLRSSSRTVTVYFATCPQELESTTCVLTSCGRVVLGAVQWANPLSHPYQLWCGECPVEDSDTEFSIDVTSRGLTFSEVPRIRRVILARQAEHFIFACSFQSSLLAASISYRCADASKSLELYLTYLLTRTEYLGAVESLIAQYGEANYLSALGLVQRLQAAGSVRPTEQLGLLAVWLLGLCQDPAEAAKQHWNGLLRLSVDLLHTKPLLQVSEPIYRGYAEIMKMCVDTRNLEWMLILQGVPLTADNQRFFVPFFAHLSKDDATYIMGEILSQGQAVDGRYLQLLLTHLDSVHTFLSLVSLLLRDEKVHWSEAECVALVNSYFDRRAIKTEEVEGVYRLFAPLPEQTRNVLIKSSLTKSVEDALKRNIEKRWMPLYQLMLLGDGKQLVPSLNAAEFAASLIPTHKFDFSSTYSTFKSVLPEAPEVFRAWLALQRQQSASELLQHCNTELCQGEAFELEVAGLAADEVYRASGGLSQYLTSCSEFRFVSSALEQSCRQRGETAIAKVMQPTIVSNELLSHLTAQHKAKATFKNFLEVALRCLKPSSRGEIRAALLSQADKNAYWVDLFQNTAALSNPAVRACFDTCCEFSQMLAAGSISYLDFSALDDAKAQRTIEVAAVAGRMSVMQLAERRSYWRSSIEASRTSVQQFHTFLGRLFPGIPLPRDVQRFLPKEFPQYCTEPVASIASLPPSLQRWQSTLYDQLLRSEIYQTLVAQRGGDPAHLLAERFAESLEEARGELERKLREVAGPPSKVSMAQVVSIFGRLRDSDREIETLSAILPNLRLDSLRGSLKFYHSLRETRVICEAVISCEGVLQFTGQRALEACRRFNAMALEAQGDFTLAHIINIASILPSICTVDVVSHQDAAEVLTAIGQHEAAVRGVLVQDEDRLATMMEMIGTQDDIAIDAKLVDNFMTVRNFVNEVMKMDSVDLLLTKVKTGLTRNQRIIDLLRYCAEKLPILEGIGEVIDITEKTKIEWILAMLNNSKATFEGDAVQLSISFQLPARPPYTKRADELEALRSQCELILASSEGEHRQKLRAFHAMVSLLFQVQCKAHELDSLGADISEIKQGKVCRIVSDRSEDAEMLDLQLSQELDIWKKGIMVESYPLTFLFGDHIWTMEKVFLKKYEMSELHKQQAVAWAEAMGKVLAVSQKNKAQKGTVQRLTQLDASLNQLAKIPSTIRHFLYMQGLQNAPTTTQQILYFETSEAFPALVSAYVQLRRKLPKSHQVMVCLESTTLGELLSFLRHCFTCHRPKLFALLHSHRLPSTLQTEGTRLLEELLPIRSPASFLVVSEDSKGHFAQFIRSKIRLWTVKELDVNFLVTDFRCIQEIAPATRVLVSEVPGLGKTNYAIAQASGRRLFIFPVSGELDTEALGLSLCEKRINEQSSLLIQIGYVEPASHRALENFLLQMVLLLSFKTRKYFFLLPADCQVSFEVQSTPTKKWVLTQSPLKYLQTVPFTSINEFVPSEDEARALAYLDVYNRNPAGLTGEVTGTVEGPRCQQVIDTCFAAECRKRGDSVSYRSIKSFLGFLSYQLKGLSMGVFVPGDHEFAALRPTVFQCFLQSTLEYTVKSMKVISSEQQLATEHKRANVSALALVQCKLGWERSNHDNVFCVNSGQLVFIYKNLTQANPVLRNLFSQQQAMLRSNPSLPNYDQMSSDDLIETLRTIHCPGRTLQKTSYVMTPDNFLKMNLIYTRMVAGIPIICMGETGCGKTHLLSFLVNTLLGETLEVVNIHAGVSAGEIEERMAQVVQQAAQRSRVWVFFDEFNTSACMGAVCEVVCDRRLNGVDLPRNIVFVAACNPYRLKPPEMLSERRAGIKHKSEDPVQWLLLHVVKPLPESLLEFVWDFGDLAKPDLKKYIYAILVKDAVENVQQYCEAIYFAHEFLAASKCASSVSLRDVKRFAIIYKWLRQVMQAKGQSRPKYLESRGLSIPPDLAALPLGTKAGAVAFYLTYVMRVSVKNKRDQLASQAAIFLAVRSLQTVVQCEQDDLIARMELPRDIVANQALRENLYTLFVCIYTRLPAILCGKPGCSKSLAYQCLFDNCRHRHSSDDWLKTLPGLNIVYFQGSLACTSDAILRSFVRAKKINAELADKLAVVVFDEIGLAELSPHNPLKVLHKELELDNAEERRGVAFVGISNWALDASKMNRMLHISRPDPTLEEVQYTARGLFHALASPQSKQYLAIADAAAKAYFDIKSAIQNKEWEDFYGLRDFYHLIKLIVRSLNALKDYSGGSVAKAVNFAVQRNFGGREEVAAEVWTRITNEYKLIQQFSNMPQCGVLELVAGNLADKGSRYLMVITDGEFAEYVLQHEIRVNLREELILVGSTLPGDHDSDTYARRRLSDMITYMERGTPVILKGMDQIYSSLYDLFNQNFKETSMGKFCRVAIGSSFMPRCFVHRDFHVILIVYGNEDSVNELDAPFLNRFEKHIFDLRLLLSQEKKALAERVDAWVKETLSPGGHPILLSPALIFPTHNSAATQLTIYRAPKDLPEEVLFEMLKRQLIAAAPSDLLVLAELAKREEGQFLKQAWRDTHTVSFAQVTEKILGSQRSLFLVFAYEFKEIADVTVKTQHLAACNTEDDLVGGVKSYLKDQVATLYCLVLNSATERKHFSFVKHTLQRLSQEEDSAGRMAKKLVLVVLQQRNIAHETTGSDYSSWSVLSVDCFGRDNLPIDDDMLRMDCVDLITRTPLLDIRASLRSLLYPLVFQLKYEPSALISDKSFINKHMFLIIENFEKHPGLVEAFRIKTFQYLKSGKIPEKDWKERLFRDPQCADRCTSTHSAVLYILEQSVRKAMAMCLFAVEMKLAMRSFFVLWTEPEGEIIREMWLTYFERMELKVVGNLQSSFQSNKVPFSVLLNFPFSLFDYELLMKHELRGSLEKFAETFTSRSVTKGFLQHINARPRLQYLYFCDIVSIAVWKEQFSPNVEELMMRLVWSLVAKESEFVLKVWQLVSNWSLISRYCGYVLLYSEFADEQVGNLLSTFLWKRALGRLPEKVTALPKSLPPSQYAPNKFADAQEKFDLPPARENAGVTEWKKEVTMAVNKSILLLYPKKKTASQHPMEKWLQWLSRFARELKGFEGLSNLSTFETLTRFPPHAESPRTFQFFVEVCGMAADSPKKSIFASKSIQKKLLKRVDELQLAASEDTLTFRVLLLAELIRNNAESVPALAVQVNEENGFWKHSAVAMEALVRCSGLWEVCRQLVAFHGSELAPLLVKNEWILAIENLLTKKPGLNSHFAVLLSDRCLAALPPSSAFAEGFLTDNFESFRLCEAVTQSRPKALPNTSTLVALTFMKWYLQMYCWVLVTPAQRTESSKDTRSMLSDIISKSQFYREVCLIYLNFNMIQRGSSVSAFLAVEKSEPWLVSTYKELESAKSSQLFFRVPQGEVFQQVRAALHDLKEPKHEKAPAGQLFCALNSVHTPEEKLQFAVAFVSEVSLYRDCRDSFPEVSQALKPMKQAIASKLGAKMGTLLEAIVENFSPGDFAHIPSGCPESEKQHRAAVHCFLAVITAFAGVEGSFTSVFFAPGGVASGDNFSRLFVPGAPHELLYEYLYAVQTNPGQFGASSWNDCGNCDNIYAIGNCGGAREVRNCPFCNSQIGGTGYVLVNRPGHRRLAPNEVPQVAAARIQKYLDSKQKPGMSGDASSFDTAGMRGISPLSLELLRYIVRCYLNFLCVQCDDNSFKRAFAYGGSAQAYFDRTLKASLDSIRKQLSNSEDYVWVFRLASELPGFLLSHTVSPRTPAARTEFERAFDSTLVRPYTSNLVEVVRQHKAAVPQAPVAYCEERDSLVAANPYMRFFRITREASVDLLISTWTLNPNPTAYPALQVAISSFKTFSTLGGIQSILDFTKYLTEKFSHRLSREAARKTPLREYIDQDARILQLFNEFSKTWESVNSDLAFACHQLAPVSFTVETEIAYFLPDVQENGGGLYMCAALYSLADRQNKLLESLAQQVPAEGSMDSVKLHIQETAPEHIFRCALADPAFIQSCYCCNPAYACGRDVAFNYDRIEQQILADFKRARLLSADNLHLFQYQGEFLTNSAEYSSIIGDIRRSIRQRPLPTQELDKLRQFIYLFERNNPLQFKFFLQEVHDSLEYVLCIVRNESVPSSASIAEAAGRYDVHQVCETLLRHREVSGTAVQHVVHLYEEFEQLCFPFVKVDKRFTEEDNTDNVGRCVARVKESGNDVLAQVRLAVVRLIVRLLDESMKESESLGQFIVKPDLWPEDASDEMLEKVGKELAEVQMKYVCQVYVLLNK